MKLYNPKNQQFKGLKLKTWASVIILLEFILIVSIVGSYAKARIRVAEAEGVFNTLPHDKIVVTKPHTPYSQYEQVHAYIESVFGSYSGKAFLVLQGKNCAENRYLNPAAIHTDNDGSQDIGIFQISTKWQGVTNKAFLMDWKTNVDMAWVIFRNSGYNFHLWTCGRGI